MILPGIQIMGTSSSGIGALGFSLSSFFIQLITFILAYLVLRKWAFGPILKRLNERRDLITKGVGLGEEMQKEKQSLEDKLAKEVAKARAEADDIISSAADTARETVQNAQGEAAAKAEFILSEAKEQTKQEMVRAKRSLEGEIISLVSDATEVIAGEKIDAKKDAALVSRALSGRAKDEA